MPKNRWSHVRIMIMVAGSLSGILASAACNPPPAPPAPELSAPGIVQLCPGGEVSFTVTFHHDPGTTSVNDTIIINGGDVGSAARSFHPNEGSNTVEAVARDNHGEARSSAVVNAHYNKGEFTVPLVNAELSCDNDFRLENTLDPSDIDGRATVRGIDVSPDGTEVIIFHGGRSDPVGLPAVGQWSVTSVGHPMCPTDMSGDTGTPSPDPEPPPIPVIVTLTLACP